MDLLTVKNGKVVDEQGRPFYLRGTCVGGWLNMENFINGYPGAEEPLRCEMARQLGPAKAEFFFERMADHFLGEADIAFMRATGSTVVRLALNYRHFEDDERPFEYRGQAFERLDQMLAWCEQHGLYAILDMHAAQGWQNTDWHSDNANRASLFWRHPHFQQRFIALWERLAQRYAQHAAIAGYDVMNEPLVNAPYGRFHNNYEPDWTRYNRVMADAVRSIRAHDPRHIVFIEGDYFGNRFEGIELPDDNIVISSHNYTAAGFGPGPYPGKFRSPWEPGEEPVWWDLDHQREVFRSHGGARFAAEHNLPLWIGEFGSVYNGPNDDAEDRLQALDDQLTVFEEFGAHWTTWTYKDVNVMGWTMPTEDSPYMRLIAPLLEAKKQLDADYWMAWLPDVETRSVVIDLAHHATQTIGDPTLNASATANYLRQHVLDGFMGGLLQPQYARLFAGKTETEIDELLRSFRFENCAVRCGLIGVVERHLRG